MMLHFTQHQQLATSNQELAFSDRTLFPTSYFLVSASKQEEVK